MKKTLLVSASLLVFVIPFHAEEPVFDGRWWGRATYGRQIGFLNGNSDCSQYELRQTDNKFRSIKQQRDLLETYYSDRAHIRIPIMEALSRISKGLKPYIIEHAKEADSHPEPHGYYDGLWWRGGEPKDEQIGFVEGYISCLPKGRTMFPEPYGTYVDKITKWYEKNSDYAKIADVLYNFSTKPIIISPKQ